ncbi:MAG TPA: YceI family protein [Gammaproteobacteria bacterium]|nr:YceI family protein [Gammaproteobacteria bacterium]
MAVMILQPVQADDYIIDNGGAHSTIQFKISHLGYSWLWGRFNNFEGAFSYDSSDLSSAGVSVTVNANSIDTNHAELNKHLRSSDFLDVNRYPEIKFIGTEYTETKNGEGHLQGELTLHGVTRQVVVVVSHVGAGDDPWGGYRRGFEGSTHIALADYGIKKDLGPAAAELELFVSLEGIKQ